MKIRVGLVSPFSSPRAEFISFICLLLDGNGNFLGFDDFCD